MTTSIPLSFDSHSAPSSAVRATDAVPAQAAKIPEPVPGAATRGRPLRLLAVATGTPESEAMIRHVEEIGAESAVCVELAADLPRAARRLGDGPWDAVVIVLTDRALDDLTWWAEALHTADGPPRLVALAPRPSIGLALLAEKLGVLDVLAAPCRRDDVLRVFDKLRSTEVERALPLPEVDAEFVGPYALVGNHPSMHHVYQLVARVAQSTATVLIQGDSGTGKEVAARAIHSNGARSAAPFIAVNCAAIPDNLLESELFGHEKGSFTGAVARKMGRFEMAIGGTLFLDEIADMSLALQAKILRAVQEREIERVGGTDVIPVDVRLIAATNRNLRAAIADGKFREDLYYRLAVVTIELPPLADRGEDLLQLVAHYTRVFGERYAKRVTAISDRALDALQRHRWPGNVRELRNVVERAVIVAADDTIRLDNLPEELRSAGAPVEDRSLGDRPAGTLASLAEIEARHIARVLSHTHGVIGAASEILGIHRNTLARKMKEYGL
jgi:DNA-binding NtrC family response regulator